MNIHSTKVKPLAETELPFGGHAVLRNVYLRIAKTSTQKIRNLTLYREEIASLNTLVDSLHNDLPSVSQYQQFLAVAHDIILTTDTNFRFILLRVIRICLNGGTEFFSTLFHDFDIVWIICTSFERDAEYLPERTQAHKIIKACIMSYPTMCPRAFVRSLVSVASQKDDQLRRVSLEALRILCVTNPKGFANGNGASVLFEAILDPNLSDISNSLLLSLLQSLGDESNRKYLNARLDLRTLLSPLTDLDSESVERSSSWYSAKNALITMMRTWTGVVLLTSDELGLPVVVKLLQDPKVSVIVQNIIVDAFVELFKPVISHVSKPRRNYNPSDFYSSINSKGGRGNGKGNELSGTFEHVEVWTGTPNILCHAAEIHRPMSSNILSSYYRKSSMDSGIKPRVSLTVEDIDMKTRSLSIDSNKPRNAPSTSGPVSISQQFDKNSKKSGGFLTSLFSSNRSKGKGKSMASTTDNIYPLSTSHSFADFERVSDIRASDATYVAGLESNGENQPDPVYNLMENYAALLCCSVIYAKLIDGLCFLATYANSSLASKSKDLLVDILRTAATIFPEAHCSDLLAMPFLIEFASIVSTNKWSNRAEKSSQVLYAMTEAFSATSIDQIRSNSKISDDYNGRNSNKDDYQSYTQSLKNVDDKKSSQRLLNSTRNISMNMKAVNSSLRLAESQDPTSPADIFELSQEMKQTSQSRVISLIESSYNHLQSKSRVIYVLRMTLISAVDKTDFNKQMELSKVLGKEGKEPLKWDWSMINDMLEFSFQHTDRLAEALKTKWIRRLSGFYRCTNDEKAYFANMDWEVSNLHYLENACNLYHVLVEDDQGMAFLSSDRRGVLFTDISREMEQLIESASRIGMTSFGMKNVFRPFSCRHTMAREYFTLLGRLTTTPQGRKILEDNKVFHHMSFLANYQSLDYISRLAVTSLTFTDNGFLSKHFLQLWACSNACNPDLKSYMYNLLLILLLSRPQDFVDWGVDVLASYLTNEDTANPILFKIMRIACEEKSLLRQLIARKVQISDDLKWKSVLTRMASIPEGLDYLRSLDVLESEITYWMEDGLRDYVIQVESLLTKAFWHTDECFERSSSATNSSIPIFVNSYAAFSMLQQPLSPLLLNEEKMGTGRKGSVYSQSSLNGVSNGIGNIISTTMTSQQQQLLQQSLDCNSAPLDLEGLIRLPWAIEAKYSTAKPQTTSEYLKIDTFLDISDLQQPISDDVVSDTNRLVKVRGVILDSKGFAIAQPIAINRIISSTLMIGINPVLSDGSVVPANEIRPQRRKSLNSTTNNQNVPTSTGTRESNGRRSSASPVPDDSDQPVSSQVNLFEWTECTPTDRQGNRMVDIGDGLFCVEIQNKPVKFIFSRVAPISNNHVPAGFNSQRPRSEVPFSSTRNSFQDPNLLTPNRYSGGYLYLKEVQYILRLETKQSLYVPMPRHFLGELGRSSDGYSILKNYHIIHKLITVARKDSNEALDRAAALWALGHIGSTDLGYTSISHIDSSLVEWAIDNVIECLNLNLRGTFFAVIGLIGRSKKGARKLLQLRWNTSVVGSSGAVAVPRDIKLLFCGDSLTSELENFDATILIDSPPLCVKSLSPFVAIGSADLSTEVLNLIAKLPGIVPIFKESKSRLEHLKINNPEIFKNRSLYLGVQDLFSNYTFKLSIRREIVKLFDLEAKLKAL